MPRHGFFSTWIRVYGEENRAYNSLRIDLLSPAVVIQSPRRLSNAEAPVSRIRQRCVRSFVGTEVTVARELKKPVVGDIQHVETKWEAIVGGPFDWHREG